MFPSTFYYLLSLVVFYLIFPELITLGCINSEFSNFGNVLLDADGKSKTSYSLWSFACVMAVLQNFHGKNDVRLTYQLEYENYPPQVILKTCQKPEVY